MFSAATKSARVATAANYIEDVFSTYLYTGNGSSQTITNGIDLSTKGGLVWVKGRSGSFGTGYHLLQDSSRGFGNSTALSSNATDAQYSSTGIIQSVSSTGFTSGASGLSNASSTDYASWTFRKQPKFFDIQTFTTGDTHAGSAYTFNHNLGSAPGFVAIKCTSSSGAWFCYHISTGTTKYLLLNDTVAAGTLSNGNWASSSTTFTVPDEAFTAGTRTYVAYLFAHNAGGFGLTGTDNVISCGSFTGGSPATVNLGYEPQWLLIKSATNADNWYIFDTMRGWTVNYSGLNYLIANSSGAENTGGSTSGLTNTGFNFNYGSGQTFIYIAIRRGPMKTPTSGTSIYGTQLQVNTPTYSFPPDLIWATNRTGNATYSNWFVDRLRGSGRVIRSYSTNAETAESYSTFSPDGANNSWGPGWTGGADYEVSGFRRAPGFFDVVCYTGTGGVTTISHNLGVVPELMIVKCRSAAASYWTVYSQPTGNTNYLYLDSTNASASFSAYWNNTTPTASVFTLGAGNGNDTNASGATYVAYLFASCPGVSKVGSYTGTGATQTINCGFTGGARWVMVKRTDSTGDWYVWDTARGMVSGTDPSLLLNSTAAEVNANSVYTTSVGFQIVSTAAGINASGGTYIFLAIA